MNIISRLHGKPRHFATRLLASGFSVWLLGVAFSPALAATTPGPTVDQSPLIIQKPLPPNIVLMLDDSGSMAWDFMPDWGYLKNTSNNDALIDASNNGVYYNPMVVYTPPLKADGTRYPDATSLTSAWINGFSPSDGTRDLTTYSSSSIRYSMQPSGSSQTLSTSSVTQAACDASYASQAGAYKKSWSPDYWGSPTGTCTITYYKYAYFQYSTGPAAGPYVVSYVAATDCGTQTNCVMASDTLGTAAPNKDAAGNTLKAQNGTALTAGQNIANWFAYYHTRILMAKSGVMDAFSSVDATYRIGFGSIDGGGGGNNNYKNLPASRYSYTDAYNSGTNYIANVVPFGDGAVSGDQKNALWSWIGAAQASGGTPLRQALDAVGKYYKTAQPWQTSAVDTTELACRQSYTILTTDGFWNDAPPSSVGNVDNIKAGPINGPNNQPFTYNPALPYSDDQSDTLADVAMKYWVNDLRPKSINEVPTSKEDPAFWQHMVTFTLGLGFDPVYANGGVTVPVDQIFAWANGDSSQAISGFSWPVPGADKIENIADLAHAAVNGHGGFASAKTPDEFSAALKKALRRASDRVGTGASLAANSTQLKTGAFAYQANYYTGNWKGDLKAIAVDPNNGMLALTPTWTAASQLSAADPSKRKIYTYNPAATPVAVVAFSDPATLSSDEQTALGVDATAQQSMINYLRGDSSKELSAKNGIYRTRETPLGDIVNSQPVYAGQPEANRFVGQVFTGSDTFGSYSATTRQGLIFVAANDGMLHAFNADTGAEVFAYLPAAVITSGLSNLSKPDYGSTSVPHQFFNDGELTIADVYFGSAWHTVAVGTTGRGAAKAIYALDVTDPTNITLLWERSAGDGKANADSIGQMTGKPVIAQTDAVASNTTGDANWSVLIGNGYNSKNGTAALLQFAVKDGTLSVHATDATTANGLAAPAVWMGDLSVGISTVAYAGDAQGRVWSFDLNKATTRGGVTTYAATPTITGTKLYTAMDAASSGNVQPITGGMLIGKNPLTQDLWVFFGTGQYLASGDLASTKTQSWYGLIVSSATSGLAVDGTKTRSSLVQRSIIAETPGTPEVLNADGTVATAAIAPARAVTATPSSPDMAGKSGWYIDLLSPTSTTAPDGTVTYTPNQTQQGERIVTPNQFQGNQLLATTRIPQAADLCNPSGRGWIMAVDPFTGTNPKSSFFDLNGDGQINQPADWIMVGGKPVAAGGMGFSSLPNNPIFMGGSMLVSFDNGSATSIKTSGTSGTLQRVSWRELIAQ